MTNIELGGLLFGVCLLLIAFRMPVAGGDVRGRRLRIRHARGVVGVPQPAEHRTVRPGVELHAVGAAAVPADGPVRDSGGLEPLAVRCRPCLGGAPPRRTGRRDHLRVWRVRLHLRVLACDGSDDGVGGAARDEAPRLFRRAGHRYARRRRNARDPDPAVGDPGDLRDHHRAVDRQAVSGRADPRNHRDARLLRRNRRPVPAQPRVGSGRCRGRVAGTSAQPLRGVAGGDHLRVGHRWNLLRRVHSDRGRGDRCGGDRRGRAGIGPAEPGGVHVESARDRASHRDDLPHPDRRRDLQRGSLRCRRSRPRWPMRSRRRDWGRCRS